MPEKITHDQEVKVETAIDESSGIVHARQTYYDPRGVLERNRRARLDGTLKSGDSAEAIHEGAEVIYHFQIPSVRAWTSFCRKHKSVVAALRSKDQIRREQAAATIRRLRPQWVVAAPGKHHW